MTLFYLNNLSCVLNLWCHMYHYLRLSWRERRTDLKKTILKNKFENLAMWKKSGQWYPRAWETVGWTQDRSSTPATLALPVSTHTTATCEHTDMTASCEHAHDSLVMVGNSGPWRGRQLTLSEHLLCFRALSHTRRLV